MPGPVGAKESSRSETEELRALAQQVIGRVRARRRDEHRAGEALLSSASATRIQSGVWPTPAKERYVPKRRERRRGFAVTVAAAMVAGAAFAVLWHSGITSVTEGGIVRTAATGSKSVALSAGPTKRALMHAAAMGDHAAPAPVVAVDPAIVPPAPAHLDRRAVIGRVEQSAAPQAPSPEELRRARSRANRASRRSGGEAQAKRTPEQIAAAAAPADESIELHPGERPVDGEGAELDALLSDVTGGVRAARAEGRRLASLPDRLERSDVVRAMSALAGRVAACHRVEDAVGTVRVRFSVAPTGTVAKVAALGEHRTSRTGACVAGVVESARFPRFGGRQMTFTYPFLLTQ